jgi:hypothetical protein
MTRYKDFEIGEFGYELFVKCNRLTPEELQKAVSAQTGHPSKATKIVRRVEKWALKHKKGITIDRELRGGGGHEGRHVVAYIIRKKTRPSATTPIAERGTSDISVEQALVVIRDFLWADR